MCLDDLKLRLRKYKIVRFNLEGLIFNFIKIVVD